MCGICGIAYFDANRSADPELLPCMTDSYKQYGAGCLAHLRGMHGLAIRDAGSRSLLPGKTPV